MKVKRILISQPRPESEKSPYYDIARSHKVDMDFKAFIHVEGIPAAEFRKQRIDLAHYSCIILNSKNAVDHYFRLANEMRYTVPEKNKYFCLTEAIALYLQKYIVYRKRKIFFAQQGISELVDPIRKNKDEKFLFPCSDKHTDKITEFLDASKINYVKGVFYRTVSSNMKDINIGSYDMVCFFSPNGIQSLFDNYPNFNQGDMLISVFGPATLASAQSKGLKVHLAAPLPKAPSMTMALDLFLKEVNTRNGQFKPMIGDFPKPEEKEPARQSATSGAEAAKPKTEKTPKAKPVAAAKKAVKEKPVKKAVAEKKVTKKAPVKKTVAAKTPAKKKPVAKPKAKPVAKKAAKPVAKSKPVKKSTAKKTASGPVAKKTATKTASKKVTAKKTVKPVKKTAARTKAAKKR